MRRIPFSQLHTLKGMAQRTRLSRDVIQRWGNVGVLLSEEGSTHGGRGVHRRFQTSELAIALLLKPFAALDVPTGQLLRMAASIRRAILEIGPGSTFNVGRAGDFELHRALQRGANGIGDNYLAIGITTGEIHCVVLESEAGEKLQWDIASWFRTAAPRPEAVVVIDLSVLRGTLALPQAANTIAAAGTVRD
jgi:hypothetical protein